MSWKDCEEVMKRIAPEITDDEMLSVREALVRRTNAKVRRGQAADPTQAARDAAAEVAGDLATTAAIEKRNRALNLAKRAELSAWVTTHFGKNLAEGLESIMVGVNRAKTGARNGAAQIQARLWKQYRGGFTADLERTGHIKQFATGALDRDVVNALWAFGKTDEAADLAKLPREAVEIARVVQKWQEVTRADANDAGAWIREYKGYITRQSHDPEKLRRMKFDAWVVEARARFDIERMMAEIEADSEEKMLRAIYDDLSTANHLQAVPKDETSPFTGPANFAKRASERRVIHFKTGDDWMAYNDKLGYGNLRESIIRGLEQSAMSTGAMQKLGTNPEQMMKTLTQDVIAQAKEAGNHDIAAAVGEKEVRLKNMLGQVTGESLRPGNITGARLAANIRAWETLSKLGGMLLAQLSDIASYAAGTRYQGRGFFTGIHESVGGLGRGLADTDRRELAASLGVVLESMAGEIGRIGEFNEPGAVSNMVRGFMKWNLSQWWTDRMRTSASFGMSHHMALQRGRAFGELNDEYKRVLSLYDIGEADWNAIRASATRQVDGRDYVLPENISDKAVADKLRTYYTDQTTFLALEPDARTRAVMLQGTRPGTWTGELLRFLTQFKSFTGSYMQKVVGRELYGRGYEGDSLIGALRNGNGEMQGMAQLILTATIAGYGSMALKDMAKGRVPRDPTESPAHAAKVFLAAMVQGGGAGIYGDFLFGEASRFGSGTIESLAGPFPSAFGRGIDLYHKALRGEDVAASAFRELLNNTPYANLFYTRIGFDYMLTYRLQESMNPGYLRRMEKRMLDENASTFFFPPSEVVK